MANESMRDYLKARDTLKYLFFGGKGGVGKTVFAAATAIWHADHGRRTMLASTNPVHSLTSLLGQDVLGKHTPVEGVKNLWAYEIETKDTIERSKEQIREKIQWFLKYADIKTKAEEFVESATMNPAFEESAMFENMIDLMFKNEYDVYVFDTAPTANARRLLGMSKVYSLWVNKMLKSREEAKTLREMLSFTKKKETDPLMEYLLGFRDRMEHARVLLTDEKLTSFFFITLPEALPIAVITRFIQWFRDFGIPVGGVLVNMLIDAKSLDAQRGGVRQEPRRDAGRAHEDHRREVRRPGARGGAAVRGRDPRPADAAAAGRLDVRLAARQSLRAARGVGFAPDLRGAQPPDAQILRAGPEVPAICAGQRSCLRKPRVHHRPSRSVFRYDLPLGSARPRRRPGGPAGPLRHAAAARGIGADPAHGRRLRPRRRAPSRW